MTLDFLVTYLHGSIFFYFVTHNEVVTSLNQKFY